MDLQAPASPKDYVTRFVLERYDQPSRVSEIAGSIGLQIIEGERPPGSRLDSVSLAGHFATSRTPVREALMVLEKEGLVELPPRRRPFVSRPDITEVRENFEIRAMLSGIVMTRVATEASDVQLGELRSLFEQMERQAGRGDAEAYFWSNVAFHEKAIEIAGNGQLSRILSSLFLRALRFRHLGLSLPGRRDRSVSDHSRLMRALEERDPALAAALIGSIIMSAFSSIDQHKSEIL